MYRINTHCFNFDFTAFLGCLYLYLIYCPITSAVAYFLEVSGLARTSTCLPICWALPQWVHSATILAWLSLQCPANQSTSVVFLLAFLIFLPNCFNSVNVSNTAACAICTTTHFAKTSTPPLVIWSSLLVALSSFKISSNMCLLLRPWMNCSLSCLSISW